MKKVKVITDDKDNDSVSIKERIYETKHGLKIQKDKDMSNAHFDIVCKLADNDPDFVKNMLGGSYMPTGNEIRDISSYEKNKLSYFLLDPTFIIILIFIFLIILFIIFL